MAGVTLPKYQQKVGISGQGVNARGDVGSAGAEWKAIGQMASTVGGAAYELGSDYIEGQQELEAQRQKTERHLINQSVRAKIDVAGTAYKSGLDMRKDREAFGTDADKEYSDYTNSVRDLLSDESLNNYPDLKQELSIDAVKELQTSRITARAKGLELLHNEAKATTNTNLENYINLGMVDEAMSLIDESEGIVYTEGEATEWRTKIPAMMETKWMNRDMDYNPQNVIDAVDNQLAGKGDSYKHLTDAQLKSGKAYAKQMLAGRQTKATEDLYDKDSKYPGLTPEEKISTLDEMRDSGAISAKTHKTEMDLVREPRQIDTSPENISAYLGYKREMNEAGNNEQKLAEILTRSNGEVMPRSMKNDLLQLSTNIQDPTSAYNRAPVKYMYEQLDESFDGDILPQSLWFAKFRGLGGYEDVRDQLNNKAKFEVGQRMEKWMSTDGAGATPNEIQKQLADEILSTKEQYKISNLPAEMEYFQPSDGEPVGNTHNFEDLK